MEQHPVAKYGTAEGSAGEEPEDALMQAVVAVLTQFMSDAATTAVFAPLALAYGLVVTWLAPLIWR